MSETAVLEQEQQETPETPEVKQLVLADICDRCNASAMVLCIHKVTDQELLFCKHHANQYDKALQEQKFVIYDQSERLLG